METLQPKFKSQSEENWAYIKIVADTMAQFWMMRAQAADKQYPFDVMLRKYLRTPEWHLWVNIFDSRGDIETILKATITAFCADRAEPESMADIMQLPGERMPKTVMDARIIEAFKRISITGEGQFTRVQSTDNDETNSQNSGVMGETIQSSRKSLINFPHDEINEPAVKVMMWTYVFYMWVMANHKDHTTEDIVFFCSLPMCVETRAALAKFDKVSPMTLTQKPSGDTPIKLYGMASLMCSFGMKETLEGLNEIKLIDQNEYVYDTDINGVPESQAEQAKTKEAPSIPSASIIRLSGLQKIYEITTPNSDIATFGKEEKRWGSYEALSTEERAKTRLRIVEITTSCGRQYNRKIMIVNKAEKPVVQPDGGTAIQTEAQDMLAEAKAGMRNGFAAGSPYTTATRDWWQVYSDQISNSLANARTALLYIDQDQHQKLIDIDASKAKKFNNPRSKLMRTHVWMKRLNPTIEHDLNGFAQFALQVQCSNEGTITQRTTPMDPAVKRALEAITESEYQTQWKDLKWEQMGDDYIFPLNKEEKCDPTEEELEQAKNEKSDESMEKTQVKLEPIDLELENEIERQQKELIGPAQPKTLLKPAEKKVLAEMIAAIHPQEQHLLPEEFEEPKRGEVINMPTREYNKDQTVRLANKLIETEKYHSKL